MENKKVKISVIVIIIILFALALFIYFNRNTENKNINKQNNNSNVIKNQTLENLSIEKVTIVTDKNNKSTFSAEVINKSDYPNNFEAIEITILDKDENIMTILYGYVGILNKDELTKLSIDSDVDISSAANVKYRVSE